MPALYTAVLSALSSIATALHSVVAHGHISDPAASFYDTSSMDNYAKTITADVNGAFAGLKWDGNAEVNTGTFMSAFPKTGYASLRDMLDQQVSDCANTRLDVPAVDVAGKGVMKWQNDQEGVGFSETHHGPCEVWIDDVMVDHQDCCRAHYGTSLPAQVSADFSVCSGNCTLRFYWLALHEPSWQVYNQCVPIVNNAAQKLRVK